MNHQKPKVLLIDDDPTLVDMYRFKFMNDGHCQLVTATRPKEGITRAKTEKPDLILLDLILPKQGGIPESLNKETGFRLLEKLKNSPGTKEIPIIIFTNLDEDTNDNVKRAKFLGAFDYWVKARFEPSEVLEKVKNILAGQKDIK